MKLNFNFGMEYTKLRRFDDLELLRQELELIESSLTRGSVHLDVDVYEFHSPPMSKLKGLLKCYREFCASYSMPVNTANECSGGGHLHISPIGRKFDEDEKKKLLRFVNNRPYIMWALNEPEDDYIRRFASRRWRCHCGCNALAGWTSEEITLACTKDHYVRVTNFSVEFRFFESPTSEHEQRMHILFANALATYALSRECERHDRRSIRSWRKREARKAFDSLVEQIGLNVSDFAFTKRNLENRWLPGYRRV